MEKEYKSTEAQRRAANEYYHRNKDRIKRKNVEKSVLKSIKKLADKLMNR